MPRLIAIAMIAGAFLLGPAVSAHATDLTVPVPADKAEKIVVDYQCGTMDPIKVVYVNAGPNSLAVVPVKGDLLVFAAVMSGSGVRYASGPYIWWSHQGDATLSDVRDGEDAKPIQCKGIR